jgi:pyruvate dehydrogenase E2 component (dihydrolipoyllysine-residue acetyltransferase)
MAELVEIKIPDIGDFTDVPVIDVMVKPGDHIGVDDALITLESDKAIMDVPATQAGVVKEVKLHVGDKVSEGSIILVIEAEEGAPAPEPASSGSVRQRAHEVAAPDSVSAPAAAPAPDSASAAAAAPAPDSASAPSPAPVREPAPSAPSPSPAPEVSTDAAGAPPPEMAASKKPHASPLARRFARELGVDITGVKGGGPSGRILKADVEGYIRTAMASGTQPASAGGALDLLPWPKVDFAKFGPVETRPLSRIRKISGPNLARNWVMIPHVTQFDEADVTELEAFRKEINEKQGKDGTRVTMLALAVKATIAALREFPEFNASLDGTNLILKKYFHIGFAVDTPEGLVVPVLRDADRKGVLQIAQETAELAATARAGKLKITDMQGGCFTISSLGGIGGTAFTPIINAPEVAVLGLSRTTHKPIYRDGAFVPRLMLPLSLSYDHRVIDGAVAVRFTTYLCSILADFRRALL